MKNANKKGKIYLMTVSLAGALALGSLSAVPFSVWADDYYNTGSGDQSYGYDETGTYAADPYAAQDDTGTDGAAYGTDSYGYGADTGSDYTDQSGQEGTGVYDNTYGQSGSDQTGTGDGSDVYGGYAFDDTYSYDTTVYGPDTGDYSYEDTSGSGSDGTYVFQETADDTPQADGKTHLNYVLSNGRKLLIIGDSRTVGMRLAVEDFRKNVTWCCLGGKGYNWMTAVGVPAVEGSIDDQTDVVCLMGVNDAWDEQADDMLPQYASYINKKAQEWKKKGARMYYVSVNPVRTDYYLNGCHVSDDSVVRWNTYMQAHLSRNVTYIDTYSEIRDHMEYADDIHYQGSTYRDIFRIICASVQAEGTGWTKLAGTRYFAWKNGNLGSGGWLYNDGNTYYLNYDGSMCRGWQEMNGEHFYFKPDGCMETGSVTIQGKKYIFNDFGVLVSGRVPTLKAETVD